MVPRTGERPKTIVLVGDLDKYHREGRAEESGIYPGMLLDSHANAADESIPNRPIPCKKHATAGGATQPWIAKEAYLANGSTVNDAYEFDTATDPDTKAVVLGHLAQRGDICMLRVAAGTNWAYGTLLRSAGNGLFAAGAAVHIAKVAENYDDSEGSGTTLIRCEIL